MAAQIATIHKLQVANSKTDKFETILAGLHDGVLILDTLDLVEGEYFHGVYHGQWEALQHYRAASEDVQWTVISPPPGALQPSERTGVFRVGEDEIIVGENGEASISQQDLAVLFINEVEDPRAIGKRITLGY